MLHNDLAVGIPGPFEILILGGAVVGMVLMAGLIAFIVWLVTRPRPPR